MDTNSKQYFSPDEAARTIGVASQTLARWRCEGGGPPFIRVGRKIMYGATDITAWMNSRRMSSTSAAAQAA
jgi:predicted site-specific integrase-resolvase